MASKLDASVAIDFARDEDVPRLADLLGLLLAQEADFAPDPEKQRRALRAIVADASMGRIYVARDGAEPVAMVSLLYTVSTAEGGKAAWLEDLVVRPDRRGQGNRQNPARARRGAGAHGRCAAHHAAYRSR